MARFKGAVAAVFAVALVGCATHPAASVAPPVAAMTANCLPLVSYSKTDQAELEKEFHDLGPAQPMLYRVVVDYLAMRDADRACIGASAKPAIPNF